MVDQEECTDLVQRVHTCTMFTINKYYVFAIGLLLWLATNFYHYLMLYRNSQFLSRGLKRLLVTNSLCLTMQFAGIFWIYSIKNPDAHTHLYSDNNMEQKTDAVSLALSVLFWGAFYTSNILLKLRFQYKVLQINLFRIKFSQNIQAFGKMEKEIKR